MFCVGLGCALKSSATAVGEQVDLEGGIYFVPDRKGRGTCNGEAFVELADLASLEKALAKNKATIGQR